MPVIPVREWTPDASALGNPGSEVIENAIPGPNSYKPLGTLTAITDAMDARPRGAIEGRDKDLTVYQYGGDASKLYRLVGTTWTDASKMYGYSTSTEERWEFVRWENKILATNWDDEPQQITFGGSTFSDLTTDFRCRRLAVVRDFVVAGNTFDSSDGNVPDRIRWSAINDETDWTVSSTTQSDYRDLKSGGQIQRVLGGEYGVIFSEKSTWRMSYVGSPVVFQVDEVLPETGLIAPGAVTRLGETAFFLSFRGFVALTHGSSVTYPGAGKFDNTLLADLDEDYLYRVTAAADPNSKRVYIAYPGAGNVSGRPNKILVYDPTLNRGSIITEDVELLWQAGAVGFTLEELDNVESSLDDLTVSLDSNQWKGGSSKLAAFNTSNQSGFFDGTSMTATIDTKEVELHTGRRARLNSFRPLVDGGSVRAKVGTRNLQTDNVSWSDWLTLSSSGRFTPRANARYFRFRIEASDDWSDAIGVQVDQSDARRAERR